MNHGASEHPHDLGTVRRAALREGVLRQIGLTDRHTPGVTDDAPNRPDARHRRGAATASRARSLRPDRRPGHLPLGHRGLYKLLENKAPAVRIPGTRAVRRRRDVRGWLSAIGAAALTRSCPRCAAITGARAIPARRRCALRDQDASPTSRFRSKSGERERSTALTPSELRSRRCIAARAPRTDGAARTTARARTDVVSSTKTQTRCG